MEYVEFVTDALGSAWALWLFGLVFSYRMIAPAQNFLSKQSADWVTERLRERRYTGLTRRFAVSFKRYVDRVFGATPRRIAGCRVWTLRFVDCAFVSFLTFLAIFWLLVFAIGEDALLDRMVTEFGQTAAVFPDWPLLQTLETEEGRRLMVYGGLGLFSLAFGLANTLVDYLSFLETRNVLARMGHSLWTDLALIAVDFVLTATIAVVGMTAVITFVGIGGSFGANTDLSWAEALSGSTLQVTEALWVGAGYALGAGEAPGLGELPSFAMSLSTFATSIWIWVFFTGTLLLRAVIYLRPVMNLIVFLVDIEKHPFRAVWLMFATGWSAAIGIAALLG